MLVYGVGGDKRFLEFSRYFIGICRKFAFVNTINQQKKIFVCEFYQFENITIAKYENYI